LQNCTITNNGASNFNAGFGGGISGPVTLESTIVSGNQNTTAPDVYGTVTAKNSAIGSLTGAALVDQGGNLPVGADFKLSATPADNGGLTATCAITLESPCVDHGSNPAGLTTDQRGAGFPRVFGSAVDIGAFEVQSLPYVFTVTNTGDSGSGSLRQAVLDTNFHPGADLISFSSLFSSPQVITLTTGQLSVADVLTISGPGAQLLTISGHKQSRIIDISTAPTSTPVNLSGMTLTSGQAPGSGGAILGTNQLLTVDDALLTNNTSSGNGGAICLSASGASTVLQRCIVSDNSAKYGGGLYSFGLLSLDGCIVTNNRSGGGGGIAAINGVQFTSLTIRNSVVANNTVSGVGTGGGAILIIDGYYAALVVENSTLSGNTAFIGGGICTFSPMLNGTLQVRNSTIAHNTALLDGGGITFQKVSLVSSVVSKNISGSSPDFYVYPGGIVSAANSSIFSKTGITNFTDLGGNRPFGEEPLLAPLADNGGSTLTHALLPGSPLINAGSNPAGLTTDQRGDGFARVFNTGADIGAYELQTTFPARINQVLINGGGIQRSRVTNVAVTFDQQVNLPANPADAFQLKRQGDNALVGLTAGVINGPNTVVTLTFSGVLSEFGSLADGKYSLTIDAGAVSNANGQLDGNGDGSGGDNYVLIGDPATNKLFRFFGDADGNGIINSVDFTAFRTVFGLAGPSYFDFNGDNNVTAEDFAAFRMRFGLMI